jgi:hypothetical protein
VGILLVTAATRKISAVINSCPEQFSFAFRTNFVSNNCTTFSHNHRFLAVFKFSFKVYQIFGLGIIFLSQLTMLQPWGGSTSPEK